MAVALEVEIGILHPDRVGEVEGHPHESATERLEEVDALAQQIDDALERVGLGRRGGIEDERAHDVGVHRRCLHVEERGVHAGQALHRGVPSRF
jgi:hypothetical protein